MKQSFSTRILVLMSACIAINMVLGQLASMLKLPIFLDSIGTIIAALLGGPWIALLTGLITNLLWGVLTSPVAAAFAPVAMVIGLTAGYMARAGLFSNWWKVVISGLGITIAVTIVATPIRTYLFGGVTGSGADFAVAYLHAVGEGLLQSVGVTVFGANLADKVVSALLAWQLVRQMPQRVLQQFGGMVRVR